MTDQAPELLNRLERILEQAQDCIRGATPEDISHEEACDDTISKIREGIFEIIPALRPPSERPVAQVREASASGMDFFKSKVDDWGALQWFERLVKAVHEQDAAVLAKNYMAFETCQNVAASSALRLVRDFESEIRAALTAERPEAAVAWRDAAFKTIADLVSKNQIAHLGEYHIRAIVSALLAIQHEEPGREMHVEYVASRGQSKVTYWVTREEGDRIRRAALSPAQRDIGR